MTSDEHGLKARRRGWAIAAAALGVAAWLSIGALADSYFRHGFSATWYTDVDGERVRVDTTTEHRVRFPNVHRPLARYVQGWPSELPRPEEMPPIDVDLRARLTVPEGPARTLVVQAQRQASITVDGEPAAERPIAPGRHALRIRWRGEPLPHPRRGRHRSDGASFQLVWQSPDDAVSPVPRAALTPSDGTWPASRVCAWWLAALLALLTGFGLYRVVRPPSFAVRRRRLAVLATAGLVVLGVGIRSIDYDVMPEFRENYDEMFATWNGWSLLEDGTTRGWSLWPNAYGDRVRYERVQSFGMRYTVISPYFEHPPLMHLLAGAAAHAGGAERWGDAKLKHARIAPIALSGLSILLLVAVARRLHPVGPGPYLAGLLYAVLPTIALQTRVIKEEDLLVPLSLGMLWFFLRWRDDGKAMRHLVAAAICAGLAPLTKVPGIVFVPALVMLVAAERGETRRAVISAAVSLAVASLLLVYAAVVDWSTFVFTQGTQAHRPVSWNLFPHFFDSPQINHNVIGRGWLLFLWLGFLGTAGKLGWRQSAVLSVPLVAYLVAIALGTGNWVYGWYIVPLYPLLCIGAGAYLGELWRRPTLLAGTLFVVLLVMYTMNFGLDPRTPQDATYQRGFRLVVMLTTALFLAPYALTQVFRDHGGARALARVTMIVQLAIVVGGSFYFVARYDVMYDLYQNFDQDRWYRPIPPTVDADPGGGAPALRPGFAGGPPPERPTRSAWDRPTRPRRPEGLAGPRLGG